MSGQPVKADASMAAVRSLYNEGLSSVDDLVVDTRSILSQQYEWMCGESPGYVQSGSGDYYVMNPEAEARFAQSLRNFHASLGNGSFNINSDYVVSLNGGKNCPDGSPGYTRTVIATNFGMLADIISAQPNGHAWDSAGAAARSAAMLQMQRLKRFLEKDRLTGTENLDVLKEIAEMLYNPALIFRAVGLLNLVSWDESGAPLFPPNFDLLVGEAAFANTGWRETLKSILDEVAEDDMSTLRGSLAWTVEIHDKMISRNGQDPIFQTLLLLLDEGETEVVGRFLHVLSGNSSSGADPLLYSAATHKFTDSRAQIVDKALRIVETGGFDSRSDSELLKEIIHLLKYPEFPAAVQSQIAIVLDKLFASRADNGVLNGFSGTMMIAGILKNLNMICRDLDAEDCSPAEWEEHISAQPEAAMLAAVAFRNLDDLDVRLLKEAVSSSPPGNWDGIRSMWHYLLPLFGPDIDSAIRVDFDPNMTSWDEHVELFLARYYGMERRFIMEGHESFLPFAKPVPADAETEIEILNPDNIGVAAYFPRGNKAPPEKEAQLLVEVDFADGPPMSPSYTINSNGHGYIVNCPGNSMMGVSMAPYAWSVSTTLMMGSAPLVVRIL